MPYVNNQGVRIYFEVKGEGPPLVLHHGTLGNSRDWTSFGYAADLARDHRLIIMDARGHGRSDKPHDPAAYDLPLRVADVTAVLDNLEINRANILDIQWEDGLVLGWRSMCRTASIR
jgi:pimeloyl-ACP methyl ester carboxylesterase